MAAIFNSTGHRLELPEIVYADGIHLSDADGKTYVDFTSGVWCTSLGHQNQRVNEAIRAQMAVLTHAGFCYSHPVVEEAATAVLSVAGFEEGAVIFLCSGSEGIEYARQVSRKITGWSLPLAFHDAYLGSFSSVVDRDSGWAIFDWETCRSCPGERRSAECEHFEEIPGEISEFLFEPGSSSGQVRFAPGPLVRNVAERVRAGGGKIIANEVTTGVGRTGSWFGFEHYGIEPDLIVLGKGLGNGYPVSAVVMNARTVRELEHSDFKYMQSHQNDPLGAAVAREVIATINDEDLIARAANNGEVFLAALRCLDGSPSVVEVRGRGMMFAIDLADEDAGRQVFNALLERGFIVCPRGATLRIDPPLITTRDQLLSFVETLEGVLAEV